MRTYIIMLALAISAVFAGMPLQSNAQVYISLSAPPLMPQYNQPQLASPNSIWTPGYWALGAAGYYWVPGAWMAPPSNGLLWTPGYWGQNPNGAGYAWNQGYWGSQVGYYGGLNYGAGYYGNGYAGGQWYGNQFRYNTAVSNVDPRYIRNVYVNRAVVVRDGYRYSYFGPGGSRLRATPEQIAWLHRPHVGLTPWQREHIAEAGRDRYMYANVNHGRPTEVVVARPLSETNRPVNFKPLTDSDRRMGTSSTVKPATHSAMDHAVEPVKKSVPASAPKHQSKPPPTSHQSTKSAPAQTQKKTGEKSVQHPPGKP